MRPWSPLISDANENFKAFNSSPRTKKRSTWIITRDEHVQLVYFHFVNFFSLTLSLPWSHDAGARCQWVCRSGVFRSSAPACLRALLRYIYCISAFRNGLFGSNSKKSREINISDECTLTWPILPFGSRSSPASCELLTFFSDPIESPRDCGLVDAWNRTNHQKISTKFGQKLKIVPKKLNPWISPWVFGVTVIFSNFKKKKYIYKKKYEPLFKCVKKLNIYVPASD